jgi:hypothetical protein
MRFKKEHVIFSGILLMMLFSQCQNTTTGNLADNFTDPSTENRPLALWTWMNGYVDTTKMVFELNEMKDKGMRGALIWDIGALSDPDKIIPEGPSFLGPESMEYISLALKTTGKLGLDLGMVASSSWNAGGEWVDEGDASMQLLSSSQVVEGPARVKIRIEIPETRRGKVEVYSLLTSLAIPYTGSKVINSLVDKTIVLDGFTSDGNLIDWEVPEGSWEVFSFFMCNTGQNLVCPSPNSSGLVIDHLSKRATKLHFDSILARLDPVSTPENHMKIMMLDSYEVWEMEDWSPHFLQEFKERYGYDPAPFLPLLLGYSDQDSVVADRFRGDYSRLVSDMMIENHFEQSVDIANENGFQMLTEAGHGGAPRVDPLKALGHSHIPMGEFWNRQRFWVTKEAASAAHIYNQKLVAAESLTGWNHWQHGPADFKQLIDIAFCEGLNQVVFHTFSHNPEIAGKPGFTYHAGEHMNVNATWWDMVTPFMDYIGRCSYMLRQGLFVGDACLYYGDQAPNFVPSKRIDPNIEQIFDDTQCLHCGQSKPVHPGDMTGYDFDYMNAEIITRDMSVENGTILLPSGQSYRVMLLPAREDISMEVLLSLEKLVNEGVILIGQKPERTTSLKNYPACDSEVQDIAEKMWGKCDGVSIFSNAYGKGKVYWGKSVKEVLAELDIQPDFQVKGIDNADKHIDYIHRRTETEDIYFVSNSSLEIEKVGCVFRVEADKVPEIWDATTGLIQRDVVYTKEDNGLGIELVLDPLASRFIVFRDHSSGKNDAGLTNDLQFGFLAGKSQADLPDPIDISEEWNVSFNPDMGGPESYQMESLVSWSDLDVDGIMYYSGTATYSRDIYINEESLVMGTEVFVAFEDIQEMARLSINGEDCGILWTPPYRANITSNITPGSNKIVVEVANTWNNRIVGDLRTPEMKAYTNTNVMNKFGDNSPLLPSGIMGKAEIVFSNQSKN